MKRNFYIVSFTFLGILLQLIAHSLIEMWYIGLLLADFPKFGFGFTWNTWVLIHNILTVLFFFGGAWIGYKEGVYWWRRIYEENSIARWREEWRKKLETVSVIKLIIAGIILMGFSAAWFHLENIGVLLRPGEQRASQNIGTSEVPNFDVSGWKTFKNTNLGIEFRYPSDYDISGNDLGTEDEVASSISVLSNRSSVLTISGAPTPVSINDPFNPQHLRPADVENFSARQTAQKIWELNKAKILGSKIKDHSISDIEQIMLSDESAYKFSAEGEYDDWQVSSILEQKTDFIFAKGPEYNLKIDYTAGNEIAIRILSTFKFLK